MLRMTLREYMDYGYFHNGHIAYLEEFSVLEGDEPIDHNIASEMEIWNLKREDKWRFIVKTMNDTLWLSQDYPVYVEP